MLVTPVPLAGLVRGQSRQVGLSLKINKHRFSCTSFPVPVPVFFSTTDNRHWGPLSYTLTLASPRLPPNHRPPSQSHGSSFVSVPSCSHCRSPPISSHRPPSSTILQRDIQHQRFFACSDSSHPSLPPPLLSPPELPALEHRARHIPGSFFCAWPESIVLFFHPKNIVSIISLVFSSSHFRGQVEVKSRSVARSLERRKRRRRGIPKNDQPQEKKPI
ncbi:hypothetical protein F5B17DRAFT_128723 [Nemania serpens]|nr:hypothetical protein F5B17DRAFT_128723 [Nemania serpens]